MLIFSIDTNYLMVSESFTIWNLEIYTDELCVCRRYRGLKDIGIHLFCYKNDKSHIVLFDEIHEQFYLAIRNET